MKRTFAVSLSAVVAAAGLTAFGPAAQASAHGWKGGHWKSGHVHVVRPGKSIQAAVNHARPGDVIQLKAGHYEGGILVTKRLTIRGAGFRTVIHPGYKDHCAKAGVPGMGFCVVGSHRHLVRGVTIKDLTVWKFKETGVYGLYTDRLTVERVLAKKNGEYGITEFRSIRGRFVHNWAIDNALDAGIYVGDIKNAHGTIVTGNYSSGNTLGLLVRHARHVKAWGNKLVYNCVGAALVNDDQRGGQGNTKLWNNYISKNNRSCPAHEEVPPLGGTGVLVLGGDHNLVMENIVTRNRGTLPSSGGIVLLPSPGGRPARHNLIKNNIVLGNSPYDLVDRSGSTTNRFRHNECRTSDPQDLC